MTDARNQVAAFLLHEARALDIRVGTNGEELVMLAPMKIPRETRRALETAIEGYRQEVIALIMAENAK